jgi:protein-tyrosine phosphatase
MTDGAALPTHVGFEDALRIDWFDAAELGGGPSGGPGGGLPGRLGLTFLPGKSGASTRYPGRAYHRDTAADLAALRAEGVVRLVLLVDDEELARWGDPQIVELGRVAGLDVRRHPLTDGAAPASHEAMVAILADVDEARSRGDVAVACMGGVGRSGTVAACALVRGGKSAVEAIGRVREVRHPTAVETDAQRRFVRDYAERVGAERLSG